MFNNLFRVTFSRCKLIEINVEDSLEIDTYYDLAIASAIFKYKNNKI